MDSVKPAPNNLSKVAYAGVSFTALFTGFIAAQNVASTVYKDLHYDGVGEICVLVAYLFLGLGSIFAAHIKKSLSHKAGFVIGSCGYGSLVIASLITSTCQNNGDAFYCDKTFVKLMNVFFTMLTGIGASIIWLTQSDYVNSAATEETKGAYNGVFWTIMQLSQILASVLVTALISVGYTYLYMVLTAFVALSVTMFSFTPKLEGVQETVESMESLSGSIKSFFEALKAKKSIFLLPGMALVGIAIAFYANFLTKVNQNISASTMTFASDEAKKSFDGTRLGYVLIALALGEVAAGLTVGRAADKYNKVKVYHLVLIVPEVGLLLTLIAYWTSNYYVLVASGFIWGYTDTALNSIVGILIGSFFNEKALQYFCVMRFFCGMGAAAGSILSLAVTDILGYSCIVAGILLVLHVVFLATKNDNIKSTGNSLLKEPLTADSEHIEA